MIRYGHDMAFHNCVGLGHFCSRPSASPPLHFCFAATQALHEVLTWHLATCMPVPISSTACTLLTPSPSPHWVTASACSPAGTQSPPPSTSPLPPWPS